MLPYDAALARVEAACASFNADIQAGIKRGDDLWLIRRLRERRDYWHVLGSKIRRRMARQQRDNKSPSVS